MNSMWGLDLLQTGSQSLSSQQPTSLSATLAVTKSIMFSLLCCFWHHSPCQDFFFFFLVLSALIYFVLRVFSSSQGRWCLLSRQQAKQKGKVYLFEKCQVKPFSERSFFRTRWEIWWWVSSCGLQETVYTTVLFVLMVFVFRMLMAYSPRLVPFSSFLSGFL